MVKSLESWNRTLSLCCRGCSAPGGVNASISDGPVLGLSVSKVGVGGWQSVQHRAFVRIHKVSVNVLMGHPAGSKGCRNDLFLIVYHHDYLHHR